MSLVIFTVRAWQGSEEAVESVECTSTILGYLAANEVRLLLPREAPSPSFDSPNME